MDRKIFFDHVRITLFGGMLTPGQVAGMSAIFDEWERRKLTVTEQLAYILATVFHECGRLMQPVREGFKATDAEARAYVKAKGYRYAVVINGLVYYGRGLVQITWLANYQKMAAIVGADLVGNPDLALQPAIAVKILFEGMLRGTFTGKKLGDYIVDAGHSDYEGARRVVNGTDEAAKIAGYARAFDTAIEAAELGQPPQPDAVVTNHPPAEAPAPKAAPPGTPPPAHVQGGAAGAGAIAAAVGASHAGLGWGWVAGAAVVAAIAVGLFFLIRARRASK